MGKILSSTRYIVLLGVIASLVLSATLFLAGLVRTGLIVFDAVLKINSSKIAKDMAIASIELADLFLIATAMYIVGIGLYELFIGSVDLPDWLLISSLDDLKEKLINVVVVVLAVSFLAQIATWDGQTNLLPYGVAIALVIAALTAFGLLRRGKKDKANAATDAYPEK